MRGQRHGLSRSKPALVAVALAVLLLAAGCGPDGIGEPRSPAERLSAPNLGRVHVYCVESEDVSVTPCQVSLDAEGAPTRVQLQEWWLRAATALRGAGTFTYKDQDWRFNWVVVTRIVPDGRKGYGWECNADAGKSPEAILDAMDDHNPGRRNGIHTATAARERGCFLAPFPAGYTYPRDTVSEGTILRWLIGIVLVVILVVTSMVMLARRRTGPRSW